MSGAREMGLEWRLLIEVAERRGRVGMGSPLKTEYLKAAHKRVFTS
jgi:hypothetical protein